MYKITEATQMASPICLHAYKVSILESLKKMASKQIQALAFHSVAENLRLASVKNAPNFVIDAILLC